jgi:vancomycin resistance protein VanJ
MRSGHNGLNFSRQALWFQAAFPGGSIALCAVAAIIFWIQPDVFAAVLVLPRWLWIFPGIFLAALGWTRERKRFVIAAFSLWFLYAVFFVQEWRSFFRLGTESVQVASANGKMVRVISLNCAGGNEKAAEEVADYHPDIVLFEETPLRPIIRQIAPKILGPNAENLSGSDVSIVTSGKLTPVPMENAESAPFSHARVRLASGLEVEVFAVRLHPYGIRADVWSPDCWREQMENRKLQRQQFQWLAREVEKVPGDIPIILGGDFNLPAGDKLFELLPNRIRDTFRVAGRGWGDTLVDDFPFIRIDQIWCDAHFRSVSTVVRKTVNSDHRMVICDLIVTEK